MKDWNFPIWKAELFEFNTLIHRRDQLSFLLYETPPDVQTERVYYPTSLFKYPACSSQV